MNKTVSSPADQAEFAALLRSTAPYATWSESTVAGLTKFAVKVLCKKGDHIELDAHYAGALYVLALGVFEFQLTVGNGRQMVACYVHTGAMMGLSGVYAMAASSEKQEMVAYVDCTVWRIPFETFNACLLGDAVMLGNVLAIMATSMRRLFDELANYTLLTAQARVARCLLLAEADPGYHRLWVVSSATPMRMKQAQIARMLGLTRQSVGLLLRGFEKDKLVTIGRERIVLLSKSGLLDVVNGRAAQV